MGTSIKYYEYVSDIKEGHWLRVGKTFLGMYEQGFSKKGMYVQTNLLCWVGTCWLLAFGTMAT